MFSLTSIVLGLFALLVFRVVFKLYFKPKSLCEFYLKQGGTGYFGFGIKFIKSRHADAQKYGDFQKYFKDQLIENPKTKFFVYNLGPKVLLYIVDPKLAKSFLVDNITNYERDPIMTDIFLPLITKGLVLTD